MPTFSDRIDALTTERQRIQDEAAASVAAINADAAQRAGSVNQSASEQSAAIDAKLALLNELAGDPDLAVSAPVEAAPVDVPAETPAEEPVQG
jgi:hypothetical protein